jgi:hypothetical protein
MPHARVQPEIADQLLGFRDPLDIADRGYQRRPATPEDLAPSAAAYKKGHKGESRSRPLTRLVLIDTDSIALIVKPGKD